LYLTLGLPNQNSVHTSPIHHACHMSRSPHLISFNHRNNIWWKKQQMKFIVMLFCPRFDFLPFTYQYPPQHSDTTHSVSTPFFPNMIRWDTIYTHLLLLSSF
jgi:hypothetical protein